MSFLNLPMNRPAALVRLPPRISQVAASSPQTPSADDERASELSSSAGANMTASVSTLASRATTETADTEVSTPSAEQLKAEEKKKRKAAAAKEKRKRRKAKAAAEKAAGQASNEKEEVSEDDEEDDDDPTAALADKFRRASVASAAASEAPGPVPPEPSTSKAVPSTDWASMTAEDEAESAANQSAPRASPIPTGPRAQFNRFPSDPSITPRLGKFWGHDERAQDRKGKQPQAGVHLPPSGFSSTNASRRGSMSTEHQDRAASPALSSGSGWQKVSGRGGKRNAFGMPSNTHQNYTQQPQPVESSWKHDRFEDGPPTQPRSWQAQQQNGYGNFNNRTAAESEDASKRGSPFYSRAPEPPWTSRSPVPYLFNEPGSRTVIDDETGKRKITLRICLKPIPALLENGSKEMARQRANIMELSCFLHFDEEWPRPSAIPISDETIFIIKLHPTSPSVKVMPPAGELKRKQKEEEAKLEALRLEEIAQAEAEAKRARDEILAQERSKERARVERDLAVAEAQRRSHSSMGVLYTAAPTLDEPAQSQPTPVQSVIDQQQGSSHAPSVVSHQSPALPHEAQMQPQQQSHFTPEIHQQQQVMYGAPPPIPHQPFIGQDGLPYIFDPATGHILPFHQAFQGPPSHMGYPLQPSPGYFFDPSMRAPTPSQSPPLSTLTPSFFAPPKSQRLEIRAPSAGEVEKRTSIKKPSAKSNLSSSFNSHRHSPLSHSTASHHLSHESENMHHFNQHHQQVQLQPNFEEQYSIPGSYLDNSGVMHFLPPNYNPYSQPQPIFYPPPPLYAPTPAAFSDPAILSMGNEVSQQQQQQQQTQE